MVAIWLVMLVALVGLGSLAAVVFAIVYAIANKKPGVALAAVLLPLGAITTVGVLAALFVGRASYQVQGPVHADIHYAIDAPPSPPSPPQISLPQFVETKTHVRAWVFFLPIAALVAAFLIFRKRGCQNGGWNFGKMMAIGMLLFLAANFFFVSASRQVEVAHGQQQAAIEHAEQVRIDIENAERKAIEAEQAIEDAQRKVEEAAQEKAAKERGIEFKSMQELWEKLNKPKIKLESDDHGATMEAEVGDQAVKIAVPAEGEAQLIVPISGDTPESLARSIARLERMVEQVSSMADQVSDAGTLVGKAMVALNETLDQKRSRVEQIDSKLEKLESQSQSAESAAVVKAEKKPTPVKPATVVLVNSEAAKKEKTAVTEAPANVAEAPKSISNASRPSWVDLPSKRVGNAQRRVIVAGDFATREECDREADRLLMVAAAEHLAAITGRTLPPELISPNNDGFTYLEARMDPRLLQLRNVDIGLDFVRREIAKDEYEETVELSFGPMKRLYTLVEFTPSVDHELLARWDEYRRQERFAIVGVGAGSVLGLLGMAFGLLKVDTWTKGYYTKRLFLGVPAAIIGMLGLLGLAVS